MNKIVLKTVFIVFVFVIFSSFNSCSDDEDDSDCGCANTDTTHQNIVTPNGYYLGLKLGNTQRTEQDVILQSSRNIFAENLPPKVDLSMYLPPVGDQGNYGTCVAWATAYNLRTGMYARQKGLSSFDLRSENNQFSPRDLFVAIDDRDKGDSCEGTYITAALDVLVNRGVCKMSTAPYSGFAGGCGLKPLQSWTEEAANFKIKNYRSIPKDLTTIKAYLNQGQMVVLGAHVGKEFYLASNDDVITEQTTLYGAHALLCCGYDDTKGPHGAFRIVNSWGSQWGDNGYVWVDYDYFCSSGTYQFIIDDYINRSPSPNLYVAYSLDDTEVNDDDEVVNPESGYDLVAYSLTDEDYDEAFDNDSQDPTWRTATYSVYNAGTETISSSKNWVIALMYYNAYNATDYGIILLDYYTDEKGAKGQFNGNWDKSEAESTMRIHSEGYAWSNVDVRGGESVSHAVYNKKEKFSWTYQMPKDLNGEYYLVLFADAFHVINESNEENNYYYWAQANGKPITYKNGVPQTSISKLLSVNSKSEGKKPIQNESTDFQTVVTPQNANAYTTAEISKLINYHKKSGGLQKKALQWKNDYSIKTKGRKFAE